MTTTNTAATASSTASDSLTETGNNESSRPGGDLAPITLSTAIASGMGASNESGVANKPSKKMPSMWSQ